MTADRTLDISALTSDATDCPTAAVQWGILSPDGTLAVYGDQRWVRSGQALDSHPGGTVVRRAITLAYGPWEDAATADARAELAALREAWARQAAVTAERGREIRAAARRLREGRQTSNDADYLLTLADRLIATEAPA